MAIIQGLTGTGDARAVAVDATGRLEMADAGESPTAILGELLLEMRGVRLGLEILNRLKTGELLELAQED